MTAIFEKAYRVPASDVNLMNHVDNQVYLRWMNEVAFEHSEVCGWGMPQYTDLGKAFVVKSHYIEYLAPVFDKEDLIFLTWISDLKGRTSTRKYQFYKASNKKPFLRAETKWVFVDMQTGRPVDMPTEVSQSFAEVEVSAITNYIQFLENR